MLKSNGSLLAAYPFRLSGGAISSNKWAWGRAEQRNALTTMTDKTAGIPRGYAPPVAWNYAQRPGGMTAINSSITEVTPSAPFVITGRNITGNAAITVSLSSPTITTLLNLTGAALVDVTVPTATLKRSVKLTGGATVDVTISAPNLGSTVGMTGSATVTVTLSSPVMGSRIGLTGTAAVTVTENGVLAKKINMTGSTVEGTELTESGIAQAVKNLLISEGVVEAGVLAAEVEGGYSMERMVRIIAAAVAGKTSGGPSGFTARNLTDTANQLVGVADVNGNRVSVTHGS